MCGELGPLVKPVLQEQFVHAVSALVCLACAWVPLFMPFARAAVLEMRGVRGRQYQGNRGVDGADNSGIIGHGVM